MTYNDDNPCPKTSEYFVARVSRWPEIQAARTGGRRIVLSRTLRNPEGVQPVDSGISAAGVGILACFGTSSKKREKSLPVPAGRVGIVLFLVCLASFTAFGCKRSSDPSGTGLAGPPTLSDYEVVVPSDELPASVRESLQDANNNLDIVLHQGRFFLAFRTAPNHFASTETTLYLVSSTDRVNWAFEAEFYEGKDVREPRFLSFDGELFLYYAVLGTNPIDFEPGEMKASQRMGPADWTGAEVIYKPGFIPWRTKTVDGIPYMITYEGGENIYDFAREPIYVHWLTTQDGFTWEPVVPGQPVVLTGGGSETDFVFLNNGSLVAVSRNEMGDETGWGMKICRAEAAALGDWECAGDPRKYDSPLLFRHGSEVYLIGRRNLTETGNYDLFRRDRGPFVQTISYELDYWFRPKRCSLWRVDPDSLQVEFVLDLPSNGDTCFPGMVPLGSGRYLVYNYTSPLDGGDTFWLQGQLNPTLIYSILLTFP